MFENCLNETGLKKEDIQKIVCTGYGRHLAKLGGDVVTEIKACAIGANFVHNSFIIIRSGEFFQPGPV